MHNTTVLSTVNYWNFLEYDYGDSTVTRFLCIFVSLKLGEATIYWAHSLEPTTGFGCPHKPLLSWFSSPVAIELLLQHESSRNGT